MIHATQSGRIRIIGPRGEFLKLSEADQKAIDQISKREATKVRSKAKQAQQPKRKPKLPRSMRAVRGANYRKGGR